MTLSALIWYGLWIAPHLLQGVVVFAMVRRKLFRQFPIFLGYIAYEMCQFCVLFTMAQLPSTTGAEYAHVHSFGLIGSVALRFGVIHEIFAHLFKSYPALNRLGRPLLRWTAGVLVVVALGLAVSTAANDANHAWWWFVMFVLDRTASFLQCGLLLGLFMFSGYLGLSWRNYVFGIALGLGILASVELAASAIGARAGSTYTVYLDYFEMATSLGSVLVWIFYILAPERSQNYGARALPEHDLEIWNKELERLIQQ